MLDHWWLIRARISFLSSQPMLAIHWLGHPSLGSWEEGERRSVPTSASNPPTWKHTDVLILQLPVVPQKHGEATRAPVTAGCLPGVRRPGVCPDGSPRRQTISDSQTMLGAGRPFPAPAPARRKAPARDRPYLGRNTAPPRAGSHSLPRRQQRGLGLAGFWGRCLCPSQLCAPQQWAQRKRTRSMSSVRHPRRGNVLTQTPKLKQIKPGRPEITLWHIAGQHRAVLHGQARRPPIPSATADSRNVTVTGVPGRCCGRSRGNEAAGQTGLPPAQPPEAPRDGSVTAAPLFFSLWFLMLF